MGNVVSYCEPQEEEPAAEEQPAEHPAEDAAEDAKDGESEGGEEEPEEEEEEPKPEINIRTSPYDPRFPGTNQARNCYTRYNEYYRCVAESGEEDDKCKFYQRSYRSICPGEWVEKWNEQRDEGNWPGKY
ncbi:g11307 [Coccomyxa viridis]|uniref:G11307 protein n=1 Tax=Coccomyxa viridis TaxID=1274662 RepID=A0ABP1GDD4_9CHLO